MLLEETLTSSTCVLLMKLGGNRYTINSKWKGVCGQARVHGRVGEGALPSFHPLEIGKKEAVRRFLNLFHLYFTTFLI